MQEAGTVLPKPEVSVVVCAYGRRVLVATRVVRLAKLLDSGGAAAPSNPSEVQPQDDPR